MTILAFPRSVSSRSPMSAIDYAVRALREALDELGYNPAICREICISAHNTHDLVEAIGLGMIDDEDIDALTEALVNGFPDVSLASGAWDVVSDTWSAPCPTPAESAEYARMIGAYDPADAPLSVPADLAADDPAWDEMALWSALQDATGPYDRYEEAELSEVGISRR